MTMKVCCRQKTFSPIPDENFWNPWFNWGGCPLPYWPSTNEKLCVKNKTVTVSHLKLYQFVISFKPSYVQTISIIAQFSNDILQILLLVLIFFINITYYFIIITFFEELLLEGPGVPDHIHMNELNQIDLYA